MNAAALQKTASPPVAAAPASAPQGGATGGITPASGQGFVPAQGAAAADGAAGTGAAQSAPTAEQTLQAIVQVLGAEYGEPIIAADGTIYMEKKKPSINNGSLALSYLVVGKLDKSTGKLTPSAEVLAMVKAKAAGGSESGQRVLVKIGDQMIWQTISKDANGKPIVTDMAAATEEELAAYQQKQQAQAAQQAAQAKLQDRGDWQQKLGTVGQGLGIFSSTGQVLSGLSGGPNPYNGKPGTGWISGWILAQRLNGKAEGKLLPSWIQQGPVATALEWGIQAYGMLDMGNDFRIIRDYIGKKPPLPIANPNAVQELVAKGVSQVEAQALAEAGAALRTGEAALRVGRLEGLALVQQTNDVAVRNMLLPEAQKGATQLIPRDLVKQAYEATDPIQSTGLKIRGNVNSGVTKGLGMLKGLITPAAMGASAISLVNSGITVKNIIDTKGAGTLVHTQQGRGALLGALSSAAFLGMYALPYILPGLGIVGAGAAAAMSTVNIASNLLGGVQMLNSYGLFGGDSKKPAGFLDNDAFRAAFLVPPLTPLGAFAFWMKSKKKQADEAAKLEAAQKLAVERLQQQRDMAKLQLQSTGQISGAVQGKDGSIVVQTNVPNDMTQLAAQLGAGSTGAPATSPAPAAGSGSSALEQQRQQLAMTAKPIR